MRRALNLLPVAWVAVALLLPGVAWLAGERQPVLGNTPKTEFPAVSVRALADEATYKQVDGTILDRLPFRRQALETRGRIGVNVFHDSTSPNVHLGDDGWLFYVPELWSCGAPGVEHAADALEIMAGAIIASGRTAGVAVAGSKMIAERDLLGDEPAGLGCIAELETKVHDRLAQTPGGIDLQGAIDRQRRLGRRVFLQSDTHWNSIGRLTFANAVLEQIRPGLARAAGVGLAPATVTEESDLGRPLGIPIENRFRPVRAVRTPKSPGALVMIGDSQLEAAFGGPSADGVTLGERILPGQPRCHQNKFAAGGCDDPVRNARHVIVETVARDLPRLMQWCWRTVSLVGEDLRGVAGRWRPLDGSPARGGLQLPSGTALLSATTPGGPVSRHARLLRIPVKRLPGGGAAALALDPASLPVPCATPSQGVTGGALFVPIPAGADLKRIRFRVTAPPGTVLGVPEEIVLDGRTWTRP